MWRILGSMALAFEWCHLVFSGHSVFLLWYRYKSYSPHRNVLEITVSLFQDIQGHFASTAWRMLSGGVSWQRLRVVFWGRGICPFLQGRLRMWWHFSLTRSLPRVAMLLDKERNRVMPTVVKVCLCSHCLWLSSLLSCGSQCHKVV